MVSLVNMRTTVTQNYPTHFFVTQCVFTPSVNIYHFLRSFYLFRAPLRKLNVSAHVFHVSYSVSW
jgi:hypothetical protein